VSGNPRPTYTPIVLGRLEKVGEKSILQYFKLVPIGSLKHISKLLPTVSGFRPGTPATLERQLQTLAHKLAQRRLTKSFARSKDEIGLYAIWRAWSERYLAPSTITENLFEALESEVEEDSHDFLSKAMVDALIAYVGASEVGQEVLIRFVTMSPFDEIGEMLTIARRAKTDGEIQETAALKGLPTRIEKDELILHGLEARIAAIEATLRDASAPKTDDTVPPAVVANDLAELKATITCEIATVRSFGETVNRLSNLVDQYSEKTRSLEQSMSETVKAMAEGARKVNLRLDDAENNILGLLEYEPRLAVLETFRRTESPVVAAAVARTSDGPFSIAAPSSNKTMTLDTIEAVLTALKAALHGEGLTKSSAEVFAQEILAAASARQAIFLKGAFAREVAAACARSLAGNAVARLPITLGANEPWASSVGSLWSQPALKGKAAIAVIVENVNCAAMAVSFDGIADLLVSRIDDGRPASVVFATLIDSPAAFPLEKLYFRLGPVFELDLMEWRGKRAKLANPGELTPNAISAIFGLMPSKPIDLEEARRLSSLAAGKRDPRFELIVDDAFSALSQLRSESAEFTAVQSLQFGWLLPYWVMRSPQTHELDAEIDGGRCDGKKVDGRLKRALDEYGSASGSDE
jgi:hypothetical protein